MQVTEVLAKMLNADSSPVTKVAPLHSLYKSNPKTDALLEIFKNSLENSHETFAVETVFRIFMEGRLEISNYLKETLLKKLF